MKKYILSIDQGTTSTRAILFNHEGQVIGIAQNEVECLFPRSGWVEQDALSIWISVVSSISELTIKCNITMDDIDSIGITNQRETSIIWDKQTGMPICKAIVWQSRQSAPICDALNDKKDFIHKKTGLLINPYFSASKIRFMLDSVPGAQERAEKGELMFGTVDSWLIYKLTNGKVHATDVTNASRTLLFNINTMKWDEELCALFNVPMIMLPEVKPSSGDFGVASFCTPNLHIMGVAGDQQAALFGQTCYEQGECKNTYGTGCFMLMNIGDKITLSQNGLLTTVAWQIGDKVTYALEGSVFIGGAVVQWLRDGLEMIPNSKESETVARQCESSHGVYVVPAFTGLGTPYWDDDARGAVFGLTRNTTKARFVRACLDSIAYQCKDVFSVMEKETGLDIKCLRVDGGATANSLLMQFQSDILFSKILLPKCLETTALGVAYLAGLASGFYQNLDDIKSVHSYQAEYNPSLSEEEVNKLYDGWKKAVNATLMFK